MAWPLLAADFAIFSQVATRQWANWLQAHAQSAGLARCRLSRWRETKLRAIADMCRDHIPVDGPPRQMAIHVRDEGGYHLVTVDQLCKRAPDLSA